MLEYESAWNLIMQGSKFPWWEWDIKSNTVKYNDLKTKMLGYDPKEFIGKGYQAFTNLVHPEDYKKTMDAMLKVLNGESKLYQVDYRIKTANNDYKWFMDRGVIIEKDNVSRPLKIRGVVIDLGKESERNADIDALLSIIYQSGSVQNNQPTLLTVCSSCLKVKNTDSHWIAIDTDLVDLIGENISHGLCPECIWELYPEYAEEILRKIEVVEK